MPLISVMNTFFSPEEEEDANVETQVFLCLDLCFRVKALSLADLSLPPDNLIHSFKCCRVKICTGTPDLQSPAKLASCLLGNPTASYNQL